MVIQQTRYILAIESSCDDTSVALLSCTPENITVINQKSRSQIDLHQQYGGVVPELAGRAHAETLFPLIDEVYDHNIPLDAVAVTAGPGLMPGLVAGVEAGKAISFHLNIPITRTNHIAGHIASVLLSEKKEQQEPIAFPALCLIVSGGHTELLLMKQHGDYTLLGATRDDAAGECFDKCAKLLGLPYPGGPSISKLAKYGNPQAIAFPRPMLHNKNFEFSFAGLKTAVLYYLKDHGVPAVRMHVFPEFLAHAFGFSSSQTPTIADTCASIQAAIVDVLVEKTFRAAMLHKPQTIIVSGGVSANDYLRKQLAKKIAGMTLPNKPTLRFPPLCYTMDNAAMIGAAAYYQLLDGDTTDWKHISADSNWRIGRDG